MTAKEKLRTAIEELSEREAEEALGYIAQRRGGDPVLELLEAAPLDDEPTSAAEEAAVQEARSEVERGETIPLEQVRHDFG